MMKCLDTSLIRTPFLFPKYSFCMQFNLWNKDTSLMQTCYSVTFVSGLQGPHCRYINQLSWQFRWESRGRWDRGSNWGRTRARTPREGMSGGPVAMWYGRRTLLVGESLHVWKQREGDAIVIWQLPKLQNRINLYVSRLTYSCLPYLCLMFVSRPISPTFEAIWLSWYSIHWL